VPWPDEEEAEEVALPVEEYQPLDLSEEEAIQRAIEESELLELGQWAGLGAQLAASASTSRAAPTLPPPPPPAPEPEANLKQARATPSPSHRRMRLPFR
jgi:hypothetical protein